MFKFVLASSTLLFVILRQGYCYPGLGHGDFGIGHGIEHLPLDSGHGGGFGGGSGGHLDGGSHQHGGGNSGGSLEGSDYHHGVSVVSIPAGKPQTFDLTGGHDGGKIFGGSFISAGAHGKTGGYAPVGHAERLGEQGGEGDIGAHYASVLYTSEHIHGAESGGGGGHAALESFTGLGGSGLGGGLGGGYEVQEGGHL